MTIRTVFMGTPAFAVPALQRLVADDRFEVVAVVTQPDRPAGRRRKPMPSPVKQVAEKHAIKVWQPKGFRRNSEAVDTLRELSPDVVAVAAYGVILPKSVLDIAPHGFINVHASLLPKYRGAAPVAPAILNGDSETGVTIMLMDEEMDHGPILAQRAIPIYPEDTRGSLTERLATLGADLLVETVPRWIAGEIEAQPQDHDAATYVKLLKKADGRIDWTQPAALIARMTRAYDPWPGAYTHFGGHLLKVLKAHAVTTEPGLGEPGDVIQLDQGVGVVSGEGVVILEAVQLAGKRAMDIESFVRGQRNFIGSRLVSENGA